MKTLAIIPARGGSKRVPGKNLRLLGGKPLVARAIETALVARQISRCVVSSDDEEVLAIARGYDPRMALPRPAEISGDVALAIDYVRHALQALETEEPERFEAIVIIQPSSPLTLPADVDATVALLESSRADTAVTVMEVDHALHPAKFKVFAGDRLLPYLEEEGGRMAAHELPHVYVRNCSVYATRRQVIEAGQIIGSDCRGHVMPRERSVDINDELDWKFVEFLFGEQV
jgi:CMP-N,N'-diacetyllegionaminic acid synthase